MMNIQKITVEYVGKSTKFPKFCSIKDTNGKWWSDGIAKMSQYKEGGTYELHTETNEKGYENIKKAVLVEGVTPPGKAPSKEINGAERGGIFHDIVPLLAAGRSVAEVVKIMKDANDVYAILKGWKELPQTSAQDYAKVRKEIDDKLYEKYRPDSDYAAQIPLDGDGEFED